VHHGVVEYKIGERTMLGNPSLMDRSFAIWPINLCLSLRDVVTIGYHNLVMKMTLNYFQGQFKISWNLLLLSYLGKNENIC